MPRKRKVEVAERALQVPEDILNDPRYKGRLANPFGEPSSPINLRNTSMMPRWFNAAIVSDKVWRAKAKGWDPVRECDLVDPQQVGLYTTSPEGYVTRGERGQEVLMQIPKQVYQAIEKAKTAYNNRNMGSPMKTKNEVVEAASAQYGDEAADYLHRNLHEGRVGPTGGVTDSYERVERREAE